MVCPLFNNRAATTTKIRKETIYALAGTKPGPGQGSNRSHYVCWRTDINMSECFNGSIKSCLITLAEGGLRDGDKNVYWPRYYSAHYYFSFDFSLEPPNTIVRLDNTKIAVTACM